MKWIDRVEAVIGHLAIPQLIRGIAVFTILTFMISRVNPHFLERIDLDPAQVDAGEIWRLVTYIFIPRFGWLYPDWFSAAIYISFLWWLGGGLEQAMGAFRVNLYYFAGMFGTTVAAFYFGATFSAVMLNASLLFAMAKFYPDAEILFMFLIPVKVKHLAWATGILIAVGALFHGLSSAGLSYAVSAIVALANFFIFFGLDLARAAGFRAQVSSRRRRFEAAVQSDEAPLHRCTVCGRTEQQAPDLEFRVAKDGEEYCVQHLPGKPVK